MGSLEVLEDGVLPFLVWRQKKIKGASLHGGPVFKNLPDNEGTQVQTLLWEDPTCHMATIDRIRINYRKVSVV